MGALGSSVKACGALGTSENPGALSSRVNQGSQKRSNLISPLIIGKCSLVTNYL